MTDPLAEIAFFLQRLDWLSVVDLALVSLFFFLVINIAKGTQAVFLLRGMTFLIVVIALLSTLLPLPAFSWLLRTALPALLVAVPVIFAPEIRRALERLGRAGQGMSLGAGPSHIDSTIEAMTVAAQRLSERRCGALVVIEREIRLDEYVETGVLLDARLSPELLLQIFHVNTPLHDGAVLVRDGRVAAATCVMPLSASGTLSPSPERQMGLRHRAALGISEVSDAVAIVVSEETGNISVAHNGRMIRRLDQNRLRNILFAFYRPHGGSPWPAWLESLVERVTRPRSETPGG